MTDPTAHAPGLVAAGPHPLPPRVLLGTAFLLALDAWLEQLGFGRGERLLGLALTGLVHGCLRWFEVQYWMTDPAGLALLVLTLLALRRGLLPLVGALGCAAAFVRETQVVAWPWIFLDRLRADGLGRALRAPLLACGPALAVYAALRWLIVPASGPALRDAILDNLGFRWRHLLDNQLYLMTVGTWGALVPLLLLFPGRLLLVARRETGAVSLPFLSAPGRGTTEGCCRGSRRGSPGRPG